MDTIRFKHGGYTRPVDAVSIDAWLEANVPPEEWPSPQDRLWLRNHPAALEGMYSKGELKEFREFRESKGKAKIDAI